VKNGELIRVLIVGILFECSMILAPVTFTFTSCAPGPALSQQSTDQIILRAEQTAQTARATFDLFVHLERDNEALLKTVNPQIHVYANTIRAHGLDWITSLRDATKAFKANRTPLNESNLNTWLTTLTGAVTQTNQYIAEARKAGH